MERIKYYLRGIWQILTRQKPLTPREQIFEVAKKQGYTSVHVIPKRYKGKRKYKKVPRITT